MVAGELLLLRGLVVDHQYPELPVVGVDRWVVTGGLVATVGVGWVAEVGVGWVAAVGVAGVPSVGVGEGSAVGIRKTLF